jgi:hypothetical protein
MGKSTVANVAITPDIIIHAHHADIPERFKMHATQKVARIEKFALPIHRVDVEVTHESNPRQAERAFHVELTCDGTGPFVRAEAAAADKYTALDLAVDRLEEQLRRLHERSKSVVHHRPSPLVHESLMKEVMLEEVAEDSTVVIDNGPLHVELSDLECKDMTVEQAVEQMELRGLYFYVFRDTDTSKACVLYRKHGYDYGLVRLDQAS